MKYLFIDIDGVLNCSSTRDLCGVCRGIEDKKVEILKQIVDLTDCKLILISSWKEYWERNDKAKQNYDANYLDAKLSKANLTIYDKVPNYGRARGQSILDYLYGEILKGTPIDSIVILDDGMFDYRNKRLTPYLVHTDCFKDGLTNEHVNQAVNILNKQDTKEIKQLIWRYLNV